MVGYRSSVVAEDRCCRMHHLPTSHDLCGNPGWSVHRHTCFQARPLPLDRSAGVSNGRSAKVCLFAELGPWKQALAEQAEAGFRSCILAQVLTEGWAPFHKAYGSEEERGILVQDDLLAKCRHLAGP